MKIEGPSTTHRLLLQLGLQVADLSYLLRDLLGLQLHRGHHLLVVLMGQVHPTLLPHGHEVPSQPLYLLGVLLKVV